MTKELFNRAKELDNYIQAIDKIIKSNGVGELYFTSTLELISIEMGIHEDLLDFIWKKRQQFKEEFDAL